MTCERAQELFADYLAGSGQAAAKLEPHLAECAECRAESQRLQSAWIELGQLSDDEPGPAVRRRFYEMLDQARASERKKEPFWSGLLHRPVFAFGMAAACLIAGLTVGFFVAQNANKPQEMALLRNEVGTLRQLITVSLLQNQSASDRLRGVDFSGRLEQPDQEVMNALIQALNFDPNVNVRLAAADALERFAKQQNIRSELREALGRQESPIVQMALINLLVGLKDREAAPMLQKLAQEPKLPEVVRVRARQGLGQLQLSSN